MENTKTSNELYKELLLTVHRAAQEKEYLEKMQ